MVISLDYTFFHSKSFEEWTRQFVILDDKDESQWYGSGSELMFHMVISHLRLLTSWSWLKINSEEARTKLGFTASFPFDLDICEEFEKMMCDPFYTSLDSLSSDETNRQDINFEPVPQPKAPDLYFKKIEEMKDWEVIDG